MAQLYRGWLQDTLGILPEAEFRLLATLIVILLLWIARRLSLRAVNHRTEDRVVRYQWKKNSLYLATSFGILLVGLIWFDWFKSVATFLGLLSAGLAIALKDIVADLAGWMFIMWRRPFEVGDRVQIGKNSGDVIDIRIFQFTILEIGNWVHADQSTGRVIHIPNWKVFSEAQANYTKGFQYIWNEIPVLITFESDWKGAKAILEEIIKNHAEGSEDAAHNLMDDRAEFIIFYGTLTPKVYTSVEESGVLLTIRYLCNPRKRRGSEEAVWEEILDRFGERPEIDLAYPTTRFYSLDTPPKGGG